MNCRSCNSPLIPFFSLGEMPLVNHFLKTQEEMACEKKYDLTVGFCKKCYLTQLLHTVPPEKLFTDYVYFSSTSSSFLQHCKKLARYFKERFSLNEKSLVMEIASNDGAFLQYIKEFNIKILGIDPAKNIAEVANKNGIPTLAEFFTYSLAEKLKKDDLQADLIYGANVLAHVPEIVDFINGVKVVLKPQGTAVFEFPYLQGLMENKFDTIYHEHVFYYSLIALQNLFKSADLELYDVEMTPVQGGSLLIFVAHPNTFSLTENLKKLVAQELQKGFDNIATYQKIESNINALKIELLTLLTQLKNESKKIVAYSAPAKGNILLNYFGIKKNYLEFIVDKSIYKQGLYTPGTHLLVHPLSKIYENKIDYLLILCWNIYEEVIAMEELKKFKNDGGKFIIPIPEIRVH